jgi:hypothetical protein
MINAAKFQLNSACRLQSSLLIFLITSLISCGKFDDFYHVTKGINAPDTVVINKEFDFNISLKNETNAKIKLTIDKNVLKSIQFLPYWKCDDKLVIDDVPNPKSVDQDFETIYLEQGDSLNYTLTGQLSESSNENLTFSVKGYDRTFVMLKPTCKIFMMSLGGMWLPGDGPFGDAMEGYNFTKEIVIIE